MYISTEQGEGGRLYIYIYPFVFLFLFVILFVLYNQHGAVIYPYPGTRGATIIGSIYIYIYI